MKGLLIKDFRLMKGQKNFFLIIAAAAAGMAVISDDAAFMPGFLTFVVSLFSLSTISYDEFDNGNAFLFTLPVSRAGYVAEKYCLSLLLGGGAWMIAVLFTGCVGAVKGTGTFSEILQSSWAVLPAAMVIEAVMLPVQFRFGGEKGRIALIGALGVLIVAGSVAAKGAEMLGWDLGNLLDSFSAASRGALPVVLTALAALFLLASLRISISVMNQKEF